MPHKCVIDLGSHDGSDTFMYLAQGYYVFAVDANPEMAAALQSALSPEQQKYCTVLNAAVTKENTTREFYINHFSPWSSFNFEKGSRPAAWIKDGAVGLKQAVTVETMSFDSLWQTYIQPHFANIEYLKIDVEGQDLPILQSLAHTSIRPRFVSCELGTCDALLAMQALGYRRFYVAPQNELKHKTVTLTDISGQPLLYTLDENTSGPFGDDLTNWTLFDATLQIINALDKTKNWYDLHGAL